MSVAVFCGASMGNNPVFAHVMEQLAQGLADRHWVTVYGGGNTGLMGVFANKAIKLGVRVIGVITHDLMRQEGVAVGLSEVHYVRSMPRRKELMIKWSRAIIV